MRFDSKHFDWVIYKGLVDKFGRIGWFHFLFRAHEVGAERLIMCQAVRIWFGSPEPIVLYLYLVVKSIWVKRRWALVEGRGNERWQNTMCLDLDLTSFLGCGGWCGDGDGMWVGVKSQYPIGTSVVLGLLLLTKTGNIRHLHLFLPPKFWTHNCSQLPFPYLPPHRIIIIALT